MQRLCLTCGYDGKPKGCRVCGRVKKKKVVYKTDAEMARDAGVKDREALMEWINSGLDGFGMTTTGSEVVDQTAADYVPPVATRIPPFKAY